VSQPAGVAPGRFTARAPGSYVVFLIGMRVNRIFAVRKWMQVANAMGPMLRELHAHPELGFLSSEFLLNWRGVTQLQYWRSFEALHAYAGNRNASHLPAWAAFNRAIGSDGSVGIWHESYLIEPGHSETIYGNMPPWGLARAFGRGQRQRSAADRCSGRTGIEVALIARTTRRGESRLDCASLDLAASEAPLPPESREFPRSPAILS
jgi:hypothetical protein